LAGVVESIETLSVVLATGLTRGWRSAWTGVVGGLLALSLVISGVGSLFHAVIPIRFLDMVVGLFLLLFGLRWLVKAILRYGGRIALRDEMNVFNTTIRQLQMDGESQRKWDSLGFSMVFGSTVLEGAEVVFTVISFGSVGKMMPDAILGSLAGISLVLILGVLLRRPLVRAPENGMKFTVGIMLSALGTLWTGDGIGIRWILGNISYLALLTVYLLVSVGIIASLRGATWNKRAIGM